MNNVIKKGFYAIAWVSLIGLNTVNADITFEKTWSVSDWLKWSGNTLDVVISNWMAYLTTFLYLIAIIMMIYWGFNILTAAGDEEKVKKGKTILMQAVAWLIVVFIANSVIGWILTWLFGAA